MRKFWIFLYNNKTKITGAVIVGLGSLQANAAVIETLLTPEQFAKFTIFAGLIVTVLGFINTQKPTIEK